MQSLVFLTFCFQKVSKKNDFGGGGGGGSGGSASEFLSEVADK